MKRQSYDDPGHAHGGKTSIRFWQAAGGSDRNLYQMTVVIKAIEYIVHNPVRRDLATGAMDWRWSSARAHAAKDDTLLLIDAIEFDQEEINRRT